MSDNIDTVGMIERSAVMTVRDLREMLDGFEDNAPVFVQTDYGDHCHTQQLLPIETVEDTNENGIEKTAYSISGIARRDDPLDDDDDDTECNVVVLVT